MTGMKTVRAGAMLLAGTMLSGVPVLALVARAGAAPQTTATPVVAPAPAEAPGASQRRCAVAHAAPAKAGAHLPRLPPCAWRAGRGVGVRARPQAHDVLAHAAGQVPPYGA